MQLKDLDFAFIAKMLAKQSDHLAGVKKFLEENFETYQRQVESLEKVDNYPRYKQEIQKLEFKKAECLEKLSHVVPNLKKINEQIAIIEQG